MTNKGVVLDRQGVSEILMGYNVIFFGEEHGSRTDHEGYFIWNEE